MLALSKDDDRVPPRDRGEARQNSTGRPRSGAVAGNGIPATAPSLAVERDRLVKKLDSIGALAVSRVGFIAHQDLRALIGQFPDLGNLFWRDTLIDAAIFREWMVGLGRRNAHQRIAHLLCEMALRFEGVGLAQDHTFPMPVTQAELADALGLTLVHVNGFCAISG